MVTMLPGGEITFQDYWNGLLPKQKQFFNSKKRYAAFVGGQGAGKTASLCASAIIWGQLTPGGLILIGRLNIPALKETTLRTFLEMMPRSLVREWRPTDNKLICKNGCEYLFRHLDMSDHEYKAHIRSLNLSHFFVDEATEISEETFLMLTGRLRRRNMMPYHFGRIATTPAGQDWIFRRFFDPKRESAVKNQYEGFVSSSFENIHLPADTIADWNTYPKDWKERYVYGSFSDFSGAIYKEFDYRMHVWDSNRTWPCFGNNSLPPAEWPVIVGVDIGGVDPWAWIFASLQPDTNNLFIWHEIYESGIIISDLADKYFAVMNNRYLEGLAYDYENQQAALEMAEFKIGGVPANKDVDAGIFKVGQYLHRDDRCVHPFTGAQGAPRLFIASHCLHTIEELSTYVWAKDRQGRFTGKPADRNSHCPDALRYLIHTFRPEPDKPKERQHWENKELDPASSMYWYLDARFEQKKAMRGRNSWTAGAMMIR